MWNFTLSFDLFLSWRRKCENLVAYFIFHPVGNTQLYIFRIKKFYLSNCLNIMGISTATLTLKETFSEDSRI